MYRTAFGSFLSIFVSFVTIGYFINNVYGMIAHKGTNVSNSVQYSYFNYTNTFSAAKDNLRFAVGFYEDDEIY